MSENMIERVATSLLVALQKHGPIDSEISNEGPVVMGTVEDVLVDGHIDLRRIASVVIAAVRDILSESGYENTKHELDAALNEKDPTP